LPFSSLLLPQGNEEVLLFAGSSPGLEISVHGVMAGLEPALLRGDGVDDAAEATFSDSDEAVLMVLMTRDARSADNSEM
jgi:hypothetical protein